MRYNRFFIVPIVNPKIEQIKALAVNGAKDARHSLDGSKVLIKLPSADEDTHNELNPFNEYTHEEILIELDKPEWNNNIV